MKLMGEIIKDEYSDLNLFETFDSRMAEAERLLQDLMVKRKICPPVDENGESECTFVEDLYADSEEAEEKLRLRLAEYERCKRATDAERARLLRNVHSIESSRSSLRNPEPKNELSEGERVARAAYNKVASQFEQAERLVVRIYKVLQQPAPRWPLGKPQKRMRLGAGTGTPERLPHTGVDVHVPGVGGGAEASPAAPRVPGELTSLAGLGGMPGRPNYQ